MTEKIAIRDAYGEALVRLGRENNNVVVLDADVSSSTRTNKFAQVFPERFFNVGVAESNMMGIAAGLATTGKIPFVNTFSFLLCLRAGDQLRTSVAYPNLNVKVAANYGGMSDSYDGPTHHAICDLAVARALPNITLVVVADAVEAKKSLKPIAEHVGPVYYRLSRAEVPVVFDESYKFEMGKGYTINDGEDLTIVATGVMVARSLDGADELKKEGIKARVINLHTLKPIDKDIITRAAEETGAIVTAEEHNIYGGLGSAVAEVLVEGKPTPMERVGINDIFTESGDYEGLLNRYGLSVDDIVKAAKKALKRKK